MAALLARANAGEAEAQYALAAGLARSGRRDDAERWLQASAAGGFADAIYTLATRGLNSLTTADTAFADLERAASSGSRAARRLIAVLCAMGIGVTRDDERALAEILALAKSGDPASAREIAGILALAAPDDPMIDALLALAAPTDPVAAVFCLARARRGHGQEAAISGARRLLESLRYPRLATFSSGPAAGGTPPPVDWKQVERTCLSPTFHLSSERLSDRPKVVVSRASVAPELCDYVIAASTPRLGPSLVYDPRADRMMRDPYRTSSTASMAPIDLDLCLVALNRAIAAAAGHPDENGEFLSVLRYAPGQLYRPHLDCIPDGADLDASGQRVATALLYLNDDFEGGETQFLASDLKFRGQPGDLLVFSNVDATGAPDPAARHAGRPVLSGEKWLASRWFRSKKFRF